MKSQFPPVPSYHELPSGIEHLQESLVESQEMFQGNYLTLLQDQVRLANDKQAVREYLIHPGAVAIVPVMPDGRILLERQYRYPLDQAFIEIPAGKLDPGEDPLVCAQRELQEETGFIANEWVFLGKIHPVISHSTESIDIYCAQLISYTKQDLDEGEFLDIFAASIEEIETWMKHGQITDVKTIIGIYWWKEFQAKKAN